MKLGLSLGYWGAQPPTDAAELVQTAQRLHFDSVWTSEAYGSDCFTPLAWHGSSTTMRLGTAVAQISARTPTATAMAALTLDHLSGGRAMLGIGASGPQVVEGWYGRPYPAPLARTREYVSVLRSVFARERVEFDGDHIQIPLRGGTGLGKALRPTVHPLRADLPILLAAQGPKNVALAAEICDGWLPLFYCPSDDSFHREALAAGFAARRGDATGVQAGQSGSPSADPAAVEIPSDFEIVCPVTVVVADDVEEAADAVRPHLALYIGGMGAKGANFHYAAMARLGFEDDCARIQDHYLAGRHREAAAAVPTAMVEKVALVGPQAKIAEEFTVWDASPVTTMLVSAPPATLRLLADLAA